VLYADSLADGEVGTMVLWVYEYPPLLRDGSSEGMLGWDRLRECVVYELFLFRKQQRQDNTA
jgi:hypothetical protein